MHVGVSLEMLQRYTSIFALKIKMCKRFLIEYKFLIVQEITSNLGISFQFAVGNLYVLGFEVSFGQTQDLTHVFYLEIQFNYYNVGTCFCII